MSNLIGNLYYIIGLIPFILSLSNIFNYFKFFTIKNWAIKFKKVTGKDPISKDYRSDGDRHLFMTYGISSIIISIWLLLGIITSSWYIYIILIVSNIIILRIGNKIKNDTINMFAGFLLTIVKCIIIYLLIMNHFHFHYNWLELIQ